MSKQEFLDQLRAGLAGLPQQDINERLTFYSEMIDDRVEEGLTEEAAVAGMDSVDKIVSQTLSEIPLSKIVKERVSSKRSMPAWAVMLIIISPRLRRAAVQSTPSMRRKGAFELHLKQPLCETSVR